MPHNYQSKFVPHILHFMYLHESTQIVDVIQTFHNILFYPEKKWSPVFTHNKYYLRSDSLKSWAEQLLLHACIEIGTVSSIQSRQSCL